jgi:hypothetical protein
MIKLGGFGAALIFLNKDCQRYKYKDREPGTGDRDRGYKTQDGISKTENKKPYYELAQLIGNPVFGNLGRHGVRCATTSKSP